jgi:hypothetical protein
VVICEWVICEVDNKGDVVSRVWLLRLKMLDLGLFAGVFAPDTDLKATGLLGSESLLYSPVPPDTPSPPIPEFVGPCPGRMLLYLSLAMALLRSIFST